MPGFAAPEAISSLVPRSSAYSTVPDAISDVISVASRMARSPGSEATGPQKLPCYNIRHTFFMVSLFFRLYSVY